MKHYWVIILKHGITYQILRFDFRVWFGQMFTDNLSQVLHALVLRVLEIVLVNCNYFFQISKKFFTFSSSTILNLNPRTVIPFSWVRASWTVSSWMFRWTKCNSSGYLGRGIIIKMERITLKRTIAIAKKWLIKNNGTSINI